MRTIVVWSVSLTPFGVSAYLIGALIRSILQERRRAHVTRIWANFALGISFAALFLVSWIVQGLAQWETYRLDQAAHGEPAVVSEYIVDFGRSTLENWQSEFLQLSAFVVLSAIFIHRGSAESKDGQERLERKIDELRALVEANGTTPHRTSSSRAGR